MHKLLFQNLGKKCFQSHPWDTTSSDCLDNQLKKYLGGIGFVRFHTFQKNNTGVWQKVIIDSDLP